MEHLKYPFGTFTPKKEYSSAEIDQLISIMNQSPARYRQLVANLPENELAKTYREGSWNVQQLVHHVADIQLLNFLRFKKALTEENYEATTILMDDWAITPDATKAPVDDSLVMLDGITRRFLFLIRSLDENAYSISFYHPVRKFHLNLKQALHMAVWHLEQHRGHILLALGLPLAATDTKTVEPNYK